MIEITKLPLIPENSGCYLFKDSRGNTIYIGKAKNLKKRVSSYFQKKDHDPKTQALVEQIESIDFIITNNEIEALILENNLIKKNKPKYNIDLRDSKKYAYLMLTNEQFPRLVVARNQSEKGRYFGPFTSAQKRDYVLELLKRGFKLRTCKKLPKKPCLRQHMNLCDAPCIGNISKEDYLEKIKKVEMVLKGKIKELKKILEKEMKTFSEVRDFEHALEKRMELEAIEYLSERQNMEKKKKYDQDIINYIVRDNKVYLILFNIFKGILENKQEFEFDYSVEFLDEFLIQYYSENKIPKEIILPIELDSSIINFLEHKKKSKIVITIPKIGEKKELLNLVEKNIEISFFSGDEKLFELQKVLNLQDIPKIIECFDVSHLGGTLTVGSMVQFRNALPYKSNYRRFKIQTVDYIDDFEGIREIVRRRYYKLKIENLEFPNLIIIDGGKGQLSSALGELKKLGLNIPLISIAKEFEEIYIPGEEEPLKLSKKNKGLLLVQNIRDEAHRFAINYNKLLRKKEMFKKE
jgi:excinuclease ABC subunit C